MALMAKMEVRKKITTFCYFFSPPMQYNFLVYVENGVCLCLAYYSIVCLCVCVCVGVDSHNGIPANGSQMHAQTEQSNCTNEHNRFVQFG